MSKKTSNECNIRTCFSVDAISVLTDEDKFRAKYEQYQSEGAFSNTAARGTFSEIHPHGTNPHEEIVNSLYFFSTQLVTKDSFLIYNY